MWISSDCSFLATSSPPLPHWFPFFQGKEVAVGIVKLHQGTVVFEDVEPHRLRGRVTRPLTRLSLRKQSDPLPGRLVTYQLSNSHEAVELPYGDKDQRGEFTLQV